MQQEITREPVAIGRFYPQNADQLRMAIPASFKEAENLSNGKEAAQNVWAYMLPHAGYIYCGNVLAQTLCHQKLADTLIILCPNHTGRGKAFSVWPQGTWKMPFGKHPIATDVVDLFLATKIYEADYLAHQNEHSIEVLLPYLSYCTQTDLPRIVPICVGTHQRGALQKAAQALAYVLEQLAKKGERVGLIVSSDMNHYEDHETCLAKDAKALERIEAFDPDGLLTVCETEHITMCGVAPCALLMAAASYFGRLRATVVAHTTSAIASGNYRQTVGYAGVQFHLVPNA